MSKIELAEWTLAALLHFAPPSNHVGKPWADDSREATVARYNGIRDAITSQCTTRTCAALLVAIAVGESGLAKDADVGPCYREGAWKGRCDAGKAASVWQAQAYGNDKAGTRITVARLFAERELAAWVVLRTARGSLSRCRHLPEEQRLAGLGGGNCRPSKSATARWKLWQVVHGWEPKVKTKTSAWGRSVPAMACRCFYYPGGGGSPQGVSCLSFSVEFSRFDNVNRVAT